MAQAEKEYPLYHPEPMWAEQEADDWWDAAVETARQSSAKETTRL